MCYLYEEEHGAKVKGHQMSSNLRDEDSKREIVNDIHETGRRGFRRTSALRRWLFPEAELL